MVISQRPTQYFTVPKNHAAILMLSDFNQVREEQWAKAGEELHGQWDILRAILINVTIHPQWDKFKNVKYSWDSFQNGQTGVN